MTKYTKKICIVIITLLLSFIIQLNSSALSYEFETVELSESNIEKIWENINLKKYDEFNIEKNPLPIVSFDVSTNENIVIGLQNNKILILDKNNIVLRCFEFTNDGTFYVKWNDENILLFMSRGTIIVEFSIDGSLINMIETDTQNVNNNELWNDIMNNTTISINGCNYSLRNDLGILNLFTFRSFSQLIKSDGNGISTIIYDANQKQLARISSTILMMSLFVFVCLFMVIGTIKKHRETQRDGSSVFDD